MAKKKQKVETNVETNVEQENYGFPKNWQPVERNPITPSKMGGPPSPIRQNPYNSGPLPPNFGLATDLADSSYPPSIASVRLFPIQGGAGTNAKSIGVSQDVVAPVAAQASAAQSTATTANKTAGTAAAGVTTVNNTPVVVQDAVTGIFKNTTIGAAGTTAPPVQPSLDVLNDGVTYGRVLQTALTFNQVDSTRPGFLATYGAVVPLVVGTTAAIFSYTSTTTSIDLTWSSIPLLFANGTTITIPPGTDTETGLTSNTTYYFYPFTTQGGSATAPAFAIVSGGVGTPLAIFYSPQSPTAAQVQNDQGNTTLNNGGVQAITPVSGTGGGHGGGSGACCNKKLIVQNRDKGFVTLADCSVGDFLLSRDGWTEITQLKFVPQKLFIRFETDYESVEVTSTHHITTAEEESKPAAQVSLSDFLIRKDGFAAIKAIKLVEDLNGEKAVISCRPFCTFYAGIKRPEILCHNAVPIS